MDHKSGHLMTRRVKHVQKGRHAFASMNDHHRGKSTTRHVEGKTRNPFSRSHHKNHKLKKRMHQREKLREKNKKQKKKKLHKTLDIDDVNEGKKSHGRRKKGYSKEKEYKDEEENRSHKNRQDSNKGVEKMKIDLKNNQKREKDLNDWDKKRNNKKWFHHRTHHYEEEERNGKVDDWENKMKDEEAKYKQHKISHNDNGKGISEDNEKTEGKDDTEDINENDEWEEENNELPSNEKRNGEDEHKPKHLNLYSNEKKRSGNRMAIKFSLERKSYKYSNRRYEQRDFDDASSLGKHEGEYDDEEEEDENEGKKYDEEESDEFLQNKGNEESKEKDKEKMDKSKTKNVQDKAGYSHVSGTERDEHDKHR